MKKLLMTTLIVGALLTLSACVGMAVPTEAPPTEESDAPAI